MPFLKKVQEGSSEIVLEHFYFVEYFLKKNTKRTTPKRNISFKIKKEKKIIAPKRNVSFILKTKKNKTYGGKITQQDF